MGVVARDIRLEPFAMLKHPAAFNDDLWLNSQVTSLAKSRDIPPSAIPGMQVQMMHGQGVSRSRIVRMITLNAPPTCFYFHTFCDVLPVRRV